MDPDRDVASRRIVHLNCVTIIDDPQSCRLIMKIKRRQVRWNWVGYVDWRLLMTGFAGGELGTQVAPVRRSACSQVVPMRRVMRRLRMREQGQQRADNERRGSLHLNGITRCATESGELSIIAGLQVSLDRLGAKAPSWGGLSFDHYRNGFFRSGGYVVA